MIDKINKLIVLYTKMGPRHKDHLEVYKLVKAEFQKASKSGKPWTPEEVLLGMIASRKDSISQYKEAGRNDLAIHEEFEIQIIRELLPPMPTEEEMREGIEEEIKKLGREVSIKDTKPILTSLKPKFPGLSGKLVSEIIKSHVSRS